MAPHGVLSEPLRNWHLKSRSVADHVDLLLGVEAFLTALSTVAVALRLGLRKRYRVPLKWSDVVIAGIVPLVWAIWGIWHYMSKVVAPDGPETLSKSSSVLFLKWMYASLVLSSCTLFVLKLSIVLFLLEAFGTTRTKRSIVYAILACQVALTICRLVGGFTACQPLSSFWNDPLQCSPRVNPFFFGSEFANLATELMLLIFPMPIIWKLQIPRAKKLAISSLFLLGSAAIVAGSVRTYLVVRIVVDPAHTYSNDTLPAIVICTFVEMNIGTIAASIPATYRPIQMVFRSLQERLRSHRSTQQTSDSGAQSFNVGSVKKAGQVTTVEVAV